MRYIELLHAMTDSGKAAEAERMRELGLPADESGTMYWGKAAINLDKIEAFYESKDSEGESRTNLVMDSGETFYLEANYDTIMNHMKQVVEEDIEDEYEEEEVIHKQSRVESLIEAVVNTGIGFLITMSVYPLVNYVCGIEMTLPQATLSTILFTVVSVVRSFLVRRFFNGLDGIKKWIINKL